MSGDRTENPIDKNVERVNRMTMSQSMREAIKLTTKKKQKKKINKKECKMDHLFM